MSFQRADNPVELAMDAAAATCLGAATVFVISAGAQLSAAPAFAAGGVALGLAFWRLRQVGGSRPEFALASFEAAPIETYRGPGDLDVLQLSADDMVKPGPEGIAAGPDELLLDDELPRLEPGSRVVRLFEPRTLPTAGELKASIDRHLGSSGESTAPPDASQALSDALAELRRSLR